MGFFRKLAKNVKDKAALQDQSMSIEKLPADLKGIKSLPVDTTPVPSQPAPAPTGIEALIRPERTDPNNQQDMQRLMDMQKQTFRNFLAPPPSDVVIQPGPYFPIDGGDLGLPMEPGTPMPPGTIFEGEVGGTPINIQEILDNLPKGVGVGGIGSVPIPDIPYEIPELTVPQNVLDFISNPVTYTLPTAGIPFQLPPELEQQIAVPQLPIDLPLELPQIENLAVPQVPLELPLQLPPELEQQLAVPQVPLELPLQLPPELEQQLAVPQVPLELPLQLPQIQKILDSLPKGVGVGSVGNIAVPNIPAGLPAIKLPMETPSVNVAAMPAIKLPMETPSVNVAAMPAIQALNEVAVPKVKTAIPTYNYNEPGRLARRDAYFASSRFD